MCIRSGAVAAWLVLLGVSVLVAGSPPRETGVPLHVSHRSGSLVPGDVVWVTVAATAPLTAVEGTAFGRRVQFSPAAIPGQWLALIPIALDTTPGAHDLAIRASSRGLEVPAYAGRLQVQGKAFATRQLRVSSQFVEPPPAETQRIAREAQTVAAVYARTGTERLWEGPFVMPVPGRPTSSFGRLSVYNGQPRGRHQGADFAAATGTPVRAPNAGDVVLATDLFLAGNTVILDHGAGLFSVFAHLSRMTVDVGVRVATGDLLGEAGATGRVTGPHLHWAVRLGEVTVDPLSLMTAVAELSVPEDTSARR